MALYAEVGGGGGGVGGEASGGSEGGDSTPCCTGWSLSDTRDSLISLCSYWPPVPANLVMKIQELDFVNMHDLLPNNILC